MSNAKPFPVEQEEIAEEGTIEGTIKTKCSSLASFPTELKMKIFKQSDFVSRVCLALACKTLHATYEKLYGTMRQQPVSLRERIEFRENDRIVKIWLGALLCSWASQERELWYFATGDRWMTAQQWRNVVKLCKMAKIYPGGIYRTLEGLEG